MRGVTIEEFDARLAVQGGKCAICGGDNWGSRNPFVDHDHKTGVFRGILCHHCNTGIGMFSDNVELVRQAVRYLEGSSAPANP